ncbi:hypothetical protein [Veronia pacifica]|nr:hypothetical protein [Veronia pacifica]
MIDIVLKESAQCSLVGKSQHVAAQMPCLQLMRVILFILARCS